MMLTNTLMAIMRKSPQARRTISRALFQGVTSISGDLDGWTFMNYGYVDLAEDAGAIPLDTEDEPERYCAQLYHHVTETVDFNGKDVLEVSCGRGGGASYMCRYLGPKSLTAIDISVNEVEFCRRVHKEPGLHFLEGDAENIPLPKHSVNVVVNIEASFCYGSIDKFFSEVRRVLRPRGYFLYADLRLSHEIDDLFASLLRSGLKIIKTEDITKNVARALRIDDHRRMGATKKHSPFLLRGVIKTFAGTEGTRIPKLLNSNRMRYLHFVLGKPLCQETQARADVFFGPDVRVNGPVAADAPGLISRSTAAGNLATRLPRRVICGVMEYMRETG